ncbi:uncharacterized protein LOC113094088 isoform X3 [Carassius auratus]|uniref:Uncharacterized protein LOC113094088 isoform X3 n=1 Tax=Carassius auratus TaxID=7957 RepID=A0A6P6P492_CARAU|nr:uncharacterized protein LOC113094088 isoform X3 [Carassius auratus]
MLDLTETNFGTMDEETMRRQVSRRYEEVQHHVVQLINESRVEMKRLEHRLLSLTTPPRTNTKTEAAEAIYGTPREFSPSIDQCITDAWGGKKMYVLLSKIGPYKIFFADIHKTSPGEELESEVINAFMHLEIKKFNSRSAERAFYIDSYEMASIWKGHSTKLKIDLSVYHYVIGIINDHYHWTVMVIMPAQKKTLFLDPLGESSVKVEKCQQVTRY